MLWPLGHVPPYETWNTSSPPPQASFAQSIRVSSAFVNVSPFLRFCLATMVSYDQPDR